MGWVGLGGAAYKFNIKQNNIKTVGYKGENKIIDEIYEGKIPALAHLSPVLTIKRREISHPTSAPG